VRAPLSYSAIRARSWPTRSQVGRVEHIWCAFGCGATPHFFNAETLLGRADEVIELAAIPDAPWCEVDVALRRALLLSSLHARLSGLRDNPEALA